MISDDLDPVECSMPVVGSAGQFSKYGIFNGIVKVATILHLLVFCPWIHFLYNLFTPNQM